jgi:hypothetical protein
MTLPMPSGAKNRAATVAVASFEGELGAFPEFLQVNDTPVMNDANPVNNPFNSSVLGAVDSVYVNNFGVDVDVFGAKVSGQELKIEAGSTEDFVRLGLFAISVDL